MRQPVACPTGEGVDIPGGRGLRSLTWLFSAAAGLALLAGCSTGPGSQNIDSVVPAPAEGNGRIAIYRPNTFVGSANTPIFSVNGELVGELRPGTVLYVERRAGQYYVDATNALRLPIKIQGTFCSLAAGQTAYVRTSIGAWGFNLELKPQDEALAEIAQARYTGNYDAVAVASRPEAARKARERYLESAREAGITPAASGQAATGLAAAPASALGLQQGLIAGDDSNSDVVGDPSGRSDPGGGLYTAGSGTRINVLDKVYYDAATGRLAIIGHYDSRYATPAIPYLDYLATFLENPGPAFSLKWTRRSSRSVDAMLARELTQQESDAQGARLGAVVDSAGNITRTGTLMLPALGISPILNGQLPGDLGVEVSSAGNGQVAVMKIRPGSAAERAGLHLVDFIYSVRPDIQVFYKSEFERQVRFAGAHAYVKVEYYRQPNWQSAYVQLDAAEDGDPWRGVTRYDLICMLYRKQGEVAAARVIEAMGIINGMVQQGEQYSGLAANTALMDSLGMAEDFKQLVAAGASGSVPYNMQYSFGLRVSQQLDSIFHLAGSPMQAQYLATVQRTSKPAEAVQEVMDAFGGQITPKVGEMIDSLIFRPGTGFLIPPELVEEEYNIHPVMVPQYLGVPSDSQLARLMLAGDYLCKQLTNRQDLKAKIAGYQTQVDYQINHPDPARRASSAYRVWTSIDGVDDAQSADGKTLSLKAARMRFRIAQTDNEGNDLADQRPDGYAEVLNGLYERLAQEFPVLHESREAAKLAAIAAWMRRQNPDARLPSDGRAAWHGPSRVKGLVYVYLTQNLQHESRVIKIAEGGYRFAFDLNSPFPVDSSVVDLRGDHTYATLFSKPPGPGGPADAAGWSTPVPGGQALVVQARQLTAAGDSAFGTSVAHPNLQTVANGAGAVGPDTSANHQLNALGKSSGALAGAATAPDDKLEALGANARSGFDTGNASAGAIDASRVQAPPGEPEDIQIPESMINNKDLAAGMLKLNVYKQQAKQARASADAAERKFETEKKADPQSAQLPVLLEQAKEARDRADNLGNMVKVQTGEIKRLIDTTVDAAPAAPAVPAAPAAEAPQGAEPAQPTK